MPHFFGGGALSAFKSNVSGGQYAGTVHTFNLHGLTFNYLEGTSHDEPENIRGWEYGKYPKVLIRLQLVGGGTTHVYGHASRWSHYAILAFWLDSRGTPHHTWFPKASVTPVTDSEWDIERYRHADKYGRRICWPDRPPGFLRA